MKPRNNSVVVFEPEYGKKHPEQYSKHPLQLGELVLFLGEIPNAPGHCAVANYSDVIWMLHTSDFREATEEEL